MELLKRCLRSRLDVLQVLKKLRLPAEQFDPPGINQPVSIISTLLSGCNIYVLPP